MTLTAEQVKQHDKIFQRAVKAGCKPTWYDGILGWAWHCGCEDGAHYIDQQCSALKFYRG